MCITLGNIRKLSILMLMLTMWNYPAKGSADETPESRSYTFSVVPQFDSSHIHKIWRPILNIIEQKTGLKFNLVSNNNFSEFEKEFLTGEADFAYMNPYHQIDAYNTQGYIPLVRDHGRNLYGIVVVRKTSLIEKVSHLDGKTIALPGPNALGASLIPRMEFDTQFNITINPRYVQNHSSVYLNVALGLADAGGGVMKTLSQQPDEVQSRLRIIHRTRGVASHPIVAHPRIPGEIQKKVLAAFLELGKSQKGRTMLKNVPVNKIGIASHEDYLPISDMGLDKYYVKE